MKEADEPLVVFHYHYHYHYQWQQFPCRTALSVGSGFLLSTSSVSGILLCVWDILYIIYRYVTFARTAAAPLTASPYLSNYSMNPKRPERSIFLAVITLFLLPPTIRPRTPPLSHPPLTLPHVKDSGDLQKGVSWTCVLLLSIVRA
jgi:hypothetical protein